MQTKSWKLVTLFLSAVVTACGCSSAVPTGPKAERTVIRVACPPGPAAEVLRVYSKGWQARNHAEVQIEEYGAEGPEARGADVWVIAPAELGRWADAGKLAPLPDDFQQTEDPFAWNGLLPLYRETLLRWGRIAFALPIIGEAPLCCYRTDLFRDAQLRLPATWKDVEDAAAFFAKKQGGPSLPPLPADDATLEREFYTVAAGYAHPAVSASRDFDPFSFHYEVHEKRVRQPRIDGPGFVRALALMQRLQLYRARPDETPVLAFRKGIGVFCLADAADVCLLQEEGSVVRDKFAVARVPATEVYFERSARVGDEPVKTDNWMPYLGAGGWLGVVPTNSEHPDYAFSLLAELAGPELSRQIVLSPRSKPPLGGDAFRSDHFDRNARWEVFDLDASGTVALKEVVQQTLEHRSVANPAFALRTPDQGKRREVLVAALRDALIKDPTADPAQVLQAVAGKWREMDKGNPTFESDYLRSIGLLRSD
jgi:ABC-type glycerol-3-phosphate transport system substrate-binding protein